MYSISYGAINETEIATKTHSTDLIIDSNYNNSGTDETRKGARGCVRTLIKIFAIVALLVAVVCLIIFLVGGSNGKKGIFGAISHKNTKQNDQDNTVNIDSVGSGVDSVFDNIASIESIGSVGGGGIDGAVWIRQDCGLNGITCNDICGNSGDNDDGESCDDWCVSSLDSFCWNGVSCTSYSGQSEQLEGASGGGIDACQ